MTRLFSALALLLPAVSACGGEPLVVAYVPNWIDTAAFAPTVEYGKLTHVNVAFENPNGDGKLGFSPRNRVLIDEAHKHGVKALISIGGGAASGDEKLKARYLDLMGDAKRAGFVAGLVGYVEAHGFDGLDVDLEGPGINKFYGPFVAELEAALRPKGKLLTCALSKGYGGASVPDDALGRFDFINVMAYDGAGPWAKDRPGQHSSVEFAKENVEYWLGRGVPRSKVVLGVPFYGYGFGPAFRSRGYGYDEIVAAHPGAENADRAGDTIWYNGIPTIRAKARYVVDEGLAGVMIWSLDNDAPGERSLLRAIDEALHARPAGARP